jgi:quercetin dioxygenase-like cupin family protein
MPETLIVADQPAPTRRQLQSFEAELYKLPQADVPTAHTFGPGFYARTITLAPGTMLTGKVHATEHIFIVSKGDITLVTEDGRKRVQAPYQAVCRPGTKRAGYAHAETVCTNVHITTETDLARLEAALIEPEALPAPEEAEALS